MPCKLPEDLNSVTDDVFSYMCNLAMEKCSKKSEKKKASCGGAAMRKRLLIKNFVAQMLAQERQRTYANCSYRKDDYDCVSEERSTRLRTYASRMVTSTEIEMTDADTEDEKQEDEEEEEVESSQTADDEEEVDDEEEEEQDDEESNSADDELNAAAYGNRSIMQNQQRSYYELNTIGCPSVSTSYNVNSSLVGNCATENEKGDEEDDDDDEEEEEEHCTSLTNCVDSRTSRSPTSGVNPVSEIFMSTHAYPTSTMDMLSYGCVDGSSLMSPSIGDNLMYMSPCTSASACSTSELMFCDSSSVIYSGTGHLYDHSGGLLPVSYGGTPSQQPSSTTAVMYSPPMSTTVAAVPGSSSSSTVALEGAYTATSLTTMCPVIRSGVGADWDEFHTVPLARDYMIDESICTPESYYSLYQPQYTSASLSNIGYASNAMPPDQQQHQHHHYHQQQQQQQSQQQQKQCSELDEFSAGVAQPNPSIHDVPRSEVSSPDFDASLAKVAAHDDALEDAPPLPSGSSTPASSTVSTSAYTVVEPLPENFLDETGALSSDSVTPPVHKIDNNNNNNNISNNKESAASKNELKLCLWSDYDKPQEQCETFENRQDSQSTVSRSVSPLHTLITMMPPMLKMGSCRSELSHKNSMSSYRRCITDLDTNTVVEEEYSNIGLNCYGSHASATAVVSVGGGDSCASDVGSTRKRSSSPYLFAVATTADDEDALDVDAADIGRHGSLCGMFMLTTSPKRLKL